MKKLIVTMALSVGLLGGAGFAYTLNQLPSTGGGHGAVFKGFENSKYGTGRGSGFKQGIHRKPRYYHGYWTGGKTFIQDEK